MNVPKGKLIPIGGNEAKEPLETENAGSEQEIDFNEGVLKQVIGEMRKKKPVIAVLPFASHYQEELAGVYEEAFGKIGHKTDPMVIHERDEVDDKKNLEKLINADGLFITGGDQSKLKNTLDGTRFLEIMHERYQNEEFVIAGTSAGAMIMSEQMIDTGSSEESVMKGITKLTKGFGFLPKTIIDTHFFNRGRLARLTEALMQKKSFMGIGISEDTALVITDGNEMRAIGSGTIIIIDDADVINTNYHKVKEREPIYIEHLVVHMLSRGSAYLLKEKKFKVL
ncbi:MAG TPA: cyanophycinase [Bacteroidales bacterium]|nr:cyanophycinase [Bacteroidales bacterium]